MKFSTEAVEKMAEIMVQECFIFDRLTTFECFLLVSPICEEDLLKGMVTSGLRTMAGALTRP